MPTARNGQYSFHHPACREDWKAQLRLSWKFQRFATRKAIVEYPWYQRTLKSLNGSPTIAWALGGPSLLATISTIMLTTTPESPTAAKRASRMRLRRCRTSTVSRRLLTPRG